MGKRSDFKKIDKDHYITPQDAFEFVIPHLPKDFFVYTDPCAGTGAIWTHMLKITKSACVGEYDMYADNYDYDHSEIADATIQQYRPIPDLFITNPPWTRTKKSGELMHRIIDNLAGQAPTWLLFDSDWAFTKQSGPYMKYCVKMVAVGRVKWFPDSKHTGKDNCAWYLFDKNFNGNTQFIGR